ncbi:MAG: ATPase [Gemmatimonadetes bacterium]|nr:ATPase [Gemmatimonadota bacterium]NIV63343.1 ATPase [Gemmatimonadota bacterium]NIY41026.1 ATPase [Gemmatimonadota bacterium]
MDGGGTRTRAAVTDLEGSLLGEGEGPAALVDPARPAAAPEAVAEAVRTAAAEADVELPARALWAGLAGAGREAERAAAEAALAALGLARAVRVGTDVEAAYVDAFGAGPGILLVAGTGSVALGRDASGRTARVGGWGAHLGDEGSGYWIGLRALGAVLRAEDGRGPGTVLREPLLRAMGVSEPAELVRAVAAAGKSRISALAGAVADVAAGGDPVAREIVDAAVGELTDHVGVAQRRLSGEEPLSVALAGGLLAPGRPLRSRVEAHMEAVGHSVLAEEVRPARGAAALARGLDSAA